MDVALRCINWHAAVYGRKSVRGPHSAVRSWDSASGPGRTGRRAGTI